VRKNSLLLTAVKELLKNVMKHYPKNQTTKKKPKILRKNSDSAQLNNEHSKKTWQNQFVSITSDPGPNKCWLYCGLEPECQTALFSFGLFPINLDLKLPQFTPVVLELS